MARRAPVSAGAGRLRKRTRGDVVAPQPDPGAAGAAYLSAIE
jgi:hypothetical protein